MRSAARPDVNPQEGEVARPSGIVATVAAPSEVKGLWLSTARKFLLDKHGLRTLDDVARAMGAHGDALREPLASAWYPEEALQAGLDAMNRVLAFEDPERFRLVMETCADCGINTFFRALIRLGTPPFVLRKIPAMWSRIRRGDAFVTVDADDESAVVHYERFPFFYDANYRVMTVAALRTLMRTCAGRDPRVEIVRYQRDALDVSISY
jgi:hypothetical protein